MKEISIFVDESGDFGEYNHISPFYIVTMVFHDQELKKNNHNMSLQEQRFFGGEEGLAKNYLKDLKKWELE